MPYDSARCRPVAFYWPGPHFGLLYVLLQALRLASTTAVKRTMARKHHIAVFVVIAVVAGLTTAGLGAVYVALGREQPFYTAALSADPDALRAGSRELESRATALYSETRQPGAWRTVFTEEQINGWLAVQLANSYSDALPDDVWDPRVAIEDDQLALGFRTRRGGVETIVSAKAAVMLTDEGDVAVRLLSVRAGSLPLPAMQVAEDIAQACRRLSLPVTWTQVDGQAVAILDVDRGGSAAGKSLSLEALELRDRSIYVAGQTQNESAETPNDQ